MEIVKRTKVDHKLALWLNEPESKRIAAEKKRHAAVTRPTEKGPESRSAASQPPNEAIGSESSRDETTNMSSSMKKGADNPASIEETRQNTSSKPDTNNMDVELQTKNKMRKREREETDEIVQAKCARVEDKTHTNTVSPSAEISFYVLDGPGWQPPKIEMSPGSLNSLKGHEEITFLVGEHEVSIKVSFE